jgi:hypothetical protein
MRVEKTKRCYEITMVDIEVQSDYRCRDGICTPVLSIMGKSLAGRPLRVSIELDAVDVGVLRHTLLGVIEDEMERWGQQR